MSSFKNCVTFIENERKLTKELHGYIFIGGTVDKMSIRFEGTKVQIHDMLVRLQAIIFAQAHKDVMRQDSMRQDPGN